MNPQTIVFLGDSITDDGTYIAFLDACLRLRRPNDRPALINLGISSETASGLSEPSHPFPRPCVHDRIDRALEETKPDWVVICYGMNDGIYYPFSEERFRAYQDGVRRALDKIRGAGARAIAMTPPPFDPASLDNGAERLQPDGLPEYSYGAPYAGYEDVLKRYADWVLTLAGEAADAVVGIHEEMLAHLAAERRRNPAYVSGDGIHPNAQGHWAIARTVLDTLFGVTFEVTPDFAAEPDRSPFFRLVRERQQLLGAAWKEHVGHTNPNKKEDALPLADALAKADSLDARLRELLAAQADLRS